jgi:hypothetical protein
LKDFDGCQETAKLISLIDRFFDCVNGATLHHKKEDCRGYTSIDDPRFDVSFSLLIVL